jgi:hypothetical protein
MMTRTKSVNGLAIVAIAFGGLLIYAGITDQSLAVALRDLVKGTADKPGPWRR